VNKFRIQMKSEQQRHMEDYTDHHRRLKSVNQSNRGGTQAHSDNLDRNMSKTLLYMTGKW